MVNSKTIVGTWDGVSDSDVRLFHLEVEDLVKARLSMAVAPEPIAVGVFTMKRASVTNAGVRALFVDDKSKLALSVVGTGVAGGDPGRGELTVSVELREGGAVVNKWRVRLLKWPGGYVQQVSKLRDAAGDALWREKYSSSQR
jgi:hypothetical protein